MAVKFADGVILGADSRTTTGAYIANRVTDKITPISEPFIYCCRSGSAADTQALADYVKYYVDVFSIQQGESLSVHDTAQLFRKFCYENKEQLLAGIIVAGWDPSSDGAVYNIPLGGSIHNQPYAIGGSGSAYIFGYCDAAYRPGMSREECEQFVIHAVSLAMERDGSSGGVIRLAIVDKDGCQRKIVSGRSIPIHWRD